MDALPCCPICRELFREPVSIHCGHHFCRGCIERCWASSRRSFACPRCRQLAPERSLRPSPELARLLEIARRLSRGQALGAEQEQLEEEEEEGEEGCPRHREPLEVFCREDAALLCAICRESRSHRAHALLPLPEAASGYKEQIQAGLQTLKDSRDKLLEFREAEMRRNWEYLEETEAERQRILSHFQGLRVALEELARHRLARLGRLQRDIARAQDESATSLTQEISRLDARVRELEEKCEEPARTFLQDIGGTLSSLGREKLQLPASPLPELEKKIQRFREENILLEETLRSFQDILGFELPEKMTVTLDPSSAHPQLRVAPDGSSVRWESARTRPRPGTEPGTEPGPGSDPSVLGSQSVTAGRRCWDVQVAPEGSWALGVVTETPGSGTGTPGIGTGTPGNRAETLETPGIGTETPGIGTGTPGNGAGTLESPGIGTGTLGNRAETLESGAETLGIEAEILGIGTGTLETPGSGAGTPGNGAGTSGIPRTGAETLESGAETLGIEAEILGIGAETPWIGTETPEIPGIGAETAGNRAETLGNGAGTPGSETGTPEIPGIGAETLESGAEIPEILENWTGTPENGAGTPGIGTGTLGIPGIGAEIPGIEAGTSGSRTGIPGNGAGTPEMGTGTPEMATGTPGSGTGTPGSPERGELWSMGLCQGQLWALTSQERIPLFPQRAPGRLRVALDYERGQVSFFDADTRSLIFAFPAASFQGRRLRPWFLLWGEGSRLWLCP